jgi:O-antigen/teichoic acid export membrane protein
MDSIKQTIGRLVGPNRVGLAAAWQIVTRRFKNDSLFRNSVYLMMSTAVMAGFGFIFWIIAARIYTPSEIGFATALISATTLLSTFGMLGFNNALIRYLPKSKKPNVTINTAIILVSLATILLSCVYLLGIRHFGPAFSSLTSSPTYIGLFLLFMVLVSINTLTDSVFIAYRASKYNVIVYTFFGLVKIALPLVLVGFGAYGIFFAYTGSVVVSFLLSFYFMRKHFNYRFGWNMEKATAQSMGKFSMATYLSSFLSGLPVLVMPTLIVSKLGTVEAAYFYMASTITTLLYVIPHATTQALLAEGSHDEKGIMSFVKGASKLISILLLPAILVLVLGGHFVLLIFGKSYADHSASLLSIMAITGIFLSINMLGSTIMKVRHQMKQLLAVNFGYLVVTILLTLLLLDRHGVLGAAWALMGGQIFICLEYLVLIYLQRPKRTTTPAELQA